MSEKKMPKIRFPEFTGDWEQRKLMDVAVISKGTQINKSELKGNGKYYVLNGGMSPSGYTDEYNTPKGTISISEGGNSCGYVAYNDECFWSGGHNYTLSQLKIDTTFLYQNLKGQEAKIMALRVGSGLPNIQKSALSEVDITYPNREEQVHIGEMLNNLDNLITLHQRKCEKIKEYKKGCLQKMFPKDGANVPEVRFPGFTDAWEQRKLKDITERIIVGLATSVTPYYRDKGVPLLRNMNIKENYLDDSDILYLDEDYANTNESKKIHTDDVLTVRTGANIGLTCLAPEKYDGCLSFTTLITTPQKDLLDSGFLMQYMNSNNGKNSIFSIITAGGKPNLNSGDLEKLEVLYPSLEEQKRISAFLMNLDNLITLHQRECEKYKELKKGLLQQMFV